MESLTEWLAEANTQSTVSRGTVAAMSASLGLTSTLTFPLNGDDEVPALEVSVGLLSPRASCRDGQTPIDIAWASHPGRMKSGAIYYP